MSEMLTAGLAFAALYFAATLYLGLADLVDQGRRVRRPKRGTGGAESLLGYDVVREAERVARMRREVGR